MSQSNDSSQAAKIVKASDGVYKVDVPRSAVATVQAADLDLVLVLKDGTKVVLVNAAIDAMDAEPPMVTFLDGKQLPSPALLAEVGKVDKVAYAMHPVSSVASQQTAAGESDGKRKGAASDADAQRRGAESDAEKTGGAAAGERAGAPVPQAAPSQTEQQAARAGKGQGAYEDPPPLPGAPPKEQSPFNSVPMKQGVAVQKPPAETLPEAPTPLPATQVPSSERPSVVIVEVSLPSKPLLDIKLVNIVGDKVEFLSGGGAHIRGAGGVAPSDWDVNPNAQSQVEVLSGSGRDDLIEGDAVAAPDGFFAKVLSLSLLGASSVLSITLTGLPTDMTVSNAVRQPDGSWKLTLAPDTDYSRLNVTLTYPVSDDTAPSQFTLGVSIDLTDSTVTRGTVERSVDVLMQDVSSAADIIGVNPVTGAPVFVLPLRGLSDEIRAGAGDDVVKGQAGNDRLYGEAGDDQLFGGVGDDFLMGAAGADLLDGGTGSDTASWSDATGSVQVDLAASTVGGAGAIGDRIVSIESAIGTGLNDVLLGTAGANRLEGAVGDDRIAGRGGADILIGGAGTDTLDYSESDAGVLINLQTEFAAGGHAQGDSISGFENVIGSAHDDLLVGTAGVNLLVGGAGDDRLVGGVGADVLDGGAGTDTADYSASQLAVTVDLDLGTGRGGDAEGDTLLSIENLVGGAGYDLLAGSASDNTLDGGSGNDRLEGRAGDDTLIGGTGDDVLVGGAGTDTMLGGAGNDTASYEDATGGVTVFVDSRPGIGDFAEGDILVGVENLIGGGFADTLIGDRSANSLEGGGGNDVLIGGAGADVLDGGADIDTADYSGSGAGVSVDLARVGTQLGGDADGDTLIAIESVKGSAYADVLLGNDLSNSLQGAAGDDLIVGGRGDDWLEGGDGKDWLSGGIGADVLHGGAGVDTADYAESNAGILIDLNRSGPQQGGAAEGDLLTSIENIGGSAFNDTIAASAEVNTIDGGGGVDTVSYVVSDAAVNVDLTRVEGQSGGDAQGDRLLAIENVTGSAHADTLTGNVQGNVLDGGDGNDLLVGRGGADMLTGGAGDDTASYTDSTAAVIVSLQAGAVGVGGDAQGDTLFGVESLIGSAFGDTLLGDAGANLLAAGAGDDLLDGRGGADTLDGGAGTDTANYSASSAGVDVDLNQSTAQSGGDAAGDILISIENLIGSSAADVFRGTSGMNVLTGGAGDDTLDGRGGADAIDGGDGIDTASYQSSSFGVQVDLASGASQASAGDASGDLLIGIENLFGSELADTLRGDAGANVLRGGGGDDLLQGRAGADTLIGGDGVDTAAYSSSTAGVSVDLQQASPQSGGDAQGDVLSEIENLQGSAFDDMLIGNTGANRLEGSAGNDLLTGWAGADTLIGGDGWDTAVYGGSNAGVTVDLSLTGAQSSAGHAAGDVLDSIEALIGSSFADTLRGTSGANALRGGDGGDMLEGRGGADILDGGNGIDTASYTSSAEGVQVDLGLTGAQISTGDAGGNTLSNIENLTGSAFADVLRGDGGVNTLTAGDGNDLLEGRGGADTLDGSAGTDTASYANSASGVTVYLNGAAGVGGDASGDVLTSIENVIGSGFDDVLVGNSSANVIDGGAGSDTASYVNSTVGVTVDLSLATAQTSAGDAAGDVLQNIENLSGSGLNDVLTGEAGANVVSGGVGNDVIEGRGGADTLDGGAGTDTASYANSSAGVQVSLLVSTQTSTGEASGDALSNFENLTGSAFADTLAGDNSANVINGGNGDDVIEGRGGADTMDGGNGLDTVSYVNSGAGVQVNLGSTVAQVSTGEASGDILSNIENFLGSAFNDTITSASSANVIDGGAGTDTVSYAGSTVGVTVDLSLGAVAQSSTGTAAGDVLTNIENLSGSGLNDVLTGDAGVNLIDGGAGNDVIEGRGGADTLDGGAGTD
ncbi:MAG: beta strand repeat-containing protein, partial [Burkholderiales bacterium]